MSGTEAIEILAWRLHAKMERLDPTDDLDWDRLTDLQKEFYRALVKEMARYPVLLRAVSDGLTRCPTTTT